MKITLSLFCLFFSYSVLSQVFSGEIKYKYTIIPKQADLNLDSLEASIKGEYANYLITDNFYKTTYFKDGKKTYSYTYDNISKRMYDDYKGKAYITYRDSRNSNNKFHGSKINRDSLETILGLECFFVEYDSEYAKTKTYYSDEIKVNYNSFKDHEVGNWYRKLKEVNGCIPIKTISEFETHTVIQEAVKIKRLELGPKDFQLPANKIRVASYSALDKRVELITPSIAQKKLYTKLIKEGINDLNLKKEYKCYLSFIVKKDGKVDYVEPVNEDHKALNQVAKAIFSTCKFKFTPGQIDGNSVSSLAYFPIVFKK